MAGSAAIVGNDSARSILDACGQNLGAAQHEVIRQLGDAGAALVVLRQHQHREAEPHERHRPVLHFGGAERFGVQPAGFLELERDFLREPKPNPRPTT